MPQRGPARILESHDDRRDVVAIIQELSAPIKALRATVLTVAAQFETQLQRAAQCAGIQLSSAGLIADGSRVPAPIIATGHQPVVYHPGLLEKELQAARLALAVNGQPINFVLDLDEQDCCGYREPDASGRMPIVSEKSFGSGLGLANSQKIVSVAPQSNLTSEAQRRAMSLYAELVGETVSVAHAVVRRACAPITAGSPLHVPFSMLLAHPQAQALLLRYVESPKLAEVYNTTLSSFRVTHKIGNAVNPFPNLAPNELPFWVWTDAAGQQSRRVLQKGEQISAGEILVPRGAMITLFLRAHCCDLFIHGLGGKSYEPAVEDIAGKLAVEGSLLVSSLAPYLVASANVYPFEYLITEYEQLAKILSLARSGPSHVAEILASFAWSAGERQMLTALGERKQKLIATLHIAKMQGGADTRVIGMDIKACDNELRGVIDRNLGVRSARERFTELQMTEQTLYRRDFPFWT